MILSSKPSCKYKGRLGLTALSIFIILFTCLISSAYAGQGTINGSVVNVRSGPGSNYDIVGTLLKDTRVDLLGSSGSWNKIKYANLQGWVASEFISAAAAGSSTPSKQIQVLNGPINVRSGPGSTYDKLSSIDDKAIFMVLGEKDGWYQIKLSDGRLAYVAGWLVQELGANTAPATPAVPVTNTTNNPGNTAVTVILNQKKMQFEVPPRIENGRTLVPLRAIFEAMGASVEWNDSTRTVTARRGSATVILPLGSTSPTVNGQTWKLEVPAKIVNGRTLAPLRFVGEAFGGQVDWNAQSRTINISYVPPQLPAAVTVKEAQVNLRQSPSTSASKVDSAAKGEIMTVLAAKDGWYQVKHGSITAWVASWVVEAASEDVSPGPSPVEPETPPVVEPEEPTPITPTPEVDNEPENALHLSRTRDASGIRIMISSKEEMEPNIKQGRGNVQYEFTDRQLQGLNYFEESIGSQLLKAKASSQGQDTLINIDFPSDLEYKLSVEENGKKLVVFIPNTVISFEKIPFGSVGDRFVIKTVCPVTPVGTISGDKLLVSIPNLGLKKDVNYSYSSDLISSMKVAANPSKISDLLISFNTLDMGKYSFAASGSNGDLNIILMRKIITPPREALVVLDPGHGGRDTGARGSQLDEKVVNLAVAQKVGELLKQKGIQAEYTRSDDIYVGLEERSAIANRLNAALFVSIHSNSNVQSAPNGTETYFYAPLENPSLYVQRDDRSKIASLLQTELINKLQRTNRGVKEANFSVLRNTQMPSSLIEMAFISNPTEQDLLLNEDFRNLAAQAIANGIEQYMNSTR